MTVRKNRTPRRVLEDALIGRSHLGNNERSWVLLNELTRNNYRIVDSTACDIMLVLAIIGGLALAGAASGLLYQIASRFL